MLKRLESLSKFIPYKNKERKEYFGIIAKRISNKIKSNLRKQKYLIYDLEDWKKLQSKELKKKTKQRDFI